MNEIKVEKNPGEERLRELGVLKWGIWTKGVSKFPWYYDESETCYFLEGDVIVTPEGRKPVRIGQGDTHGVCPVFGISANPSASTIVSVDPPLSFSPGSAPFLFSRFLRLYSLMFSKENDKTGAGRRTICEAEMKRS